MPAPYVSFTFGDPKPVPPTLTPTLSLVGVSAGARPSNYGWTGGGSGGSSGGGSFVAGGDLSGTATAQTVVGLEGKPLDAATVGAPSNGQVVQYDNVSGKWKAVSLVAPTISFRDTHANRATTSASANPTALYFESDRGNACYESQGGAWILVGGEYVAAFSSRPTDLGPNDAGFRFAASDTFVRYQWNGSAWVQINGTDWQSALRTTSNTGLPATGAGVEISWAAGGPFGVISSYNRGASTYQSFHLNGNPLLLNLDSAAFVGIGTSAPAAMLDVNGVVRATGFTSPATGVGVEIEYSGGTGFLQSINRTAAAYVPLKIEANPVTINATSGGKVGIGVPTPQAGLHSAVSTIIGVANAQVIPDANIGTSQVEIWIDETNSRLTFRVKYSTGTVKTGTVTVS
jgi:hypothetical protein